MSSRFKYNTDQHFAVVPVLRDSLGRTIIPTNCIAHGPLSAILPEKAFVDFRADASELLAQGHKIQAEQLAQAKRDSEEREELRTAIADVASKIDELTSRLNEREQSEWEEAARQAQFDEEPLPAPPGIRAMDEDPDGEPARGPDPTADLHSIQAKNTDNEGDLPEELELEEGGSEIPEPPEPPGHAYPQPTAISLNSK